jgi:hypothetical protein
VVALIDELETCLEVKTKPAGRLARQLNMPTSIAKVMPVPRLLKRNVTGLSEKPWPCLARKAASEKEWKLKRKTLLPNTKTGTGHVQCQALKAKRTKNKMQTRSWEFPTQKPKPV